VDDSNRKGKLYDFIKITVLVGFIYVHFVLVISMGFFPNLKLLAAYYTDVLYLTLCLPLYNDKLLEQV